MENIRLQILFQDDYLVAVDKPPGLLVHRSRIDVHATEFALQKLRDQIDRPVFPVHRIDRPTSGVLLFALDSETARTVCKQFENRLVQKTYTALVRGWAADAGVWDEPLVEKRDRMTDSKARPDKAAQSARTEFNVVKRWQVPFSAGKYPHSRYSLLTVQPHTGRKHQIRRHFNHMAHPIVGDTTYGDRRHNRLFRQQFEVQRLLLVASLLKIEHPKTGAEVCIKAGVGAEFERAIRALDATA